MCVGMCHTAPKETEVEVVVSSRAVRMLLEDAPSISPSASSNPSTKRRVKREVAQSDCRPWTHWRRVSESHTYIGQDHEGLGRC